MSISLRQLSRSRRLRAMGALAWLMLVVQSLTAMPMPMNMHQSAPLGHASHSASMPVAPSCHPHLADAKARHCCDGHGRCCSGLAGGACSCAAMASTTLPSAVVSILPSILPAATYASRRDRGAPPLRHGPPLRPPAA